MKRRKAIRGILALTGIGVTSITAKEFFRINSSIEKGQLHRFTNAIAELADVIIPTSDTPGAKEAKVQEYIIDYMESCASKKEYSNFLNGLMELQENCLNDYGIPFENCLEDQKVMIVEDLAHSGFSNSLLSKIDAKLRGRSFFSMLKNLTIEGYCTSKQGAMELLAYQPIPGRYMAIVNIQPDQKAWAIN